jgi:hypothetical protein
MEHNQIEHNQDNNVNCKMIVELNSNNSKNIIETADLEQLLCWRKMLMWRSKFVIKESYDLILKRLELVCPHENVVDDCVELDCDSDAYIKYCLDCYSTWDR